MDLINYLLQPDVITVFDIDGTLAAYEFGYLQHSACDNKYWESYVRDNRPYDSIPAIPRMKAFIREKCTVTNVNVYVCSVSEEYEKEQKKGFILREYPEINPDNIYFVASKDDKIKLLHKLSDITGCQTKVAIIDDTVKTLDMIYDNSNFTTVHVSSFFTR